MKVDPLIWSQFGPELDSHQPLVLRHPLLWGPWQNTDPQKISCYQVRRAEGTQYRSRPLCFPDSSYSCAIILSPETSGFLWVAAQHGTNWVAVSPQGSQSRPVQFATRGGQSYFKSNMTSPRHIMTARTLVPGIAWPIAKDRGVIPAQNEFFQYIVTSYWLSFRVAWPTGRLRKEADQRPTQWRPCTELYVFYSTSGCLPVAACGTGGLPSPANSIFRLFTLRLISRPLDSPYSCVSSAKMLGWLQTSKLHQLSKLSGHPSGPGPQEEAQKYSY
jgi:hypothetical protein